MPSSNEQALSAPDLNSADSTELNDEAVSEYLKDNNDFLERNPEMLDYLQISHATGSAVSLVEKQVSVLRERNVDLRHRLKSLTTNARENDKLFEQTRELVLKLIDAESVDALHKCFTRAMVDDFGVDYASMILYTEATGNTEATGTTECRIESRENAQAQVGSLFRGNKAVCGALRKEELKFLFPKGGDAGSAAMIPLIAGGKNGDQIGIVAIGSADANRYHSNVGTLFLSHIADVMVRTLSRLQQD